MTRLRDAIEAKITELGLSAPIHVSLIHRDTGSPNGPWEISWQRLIDQTGGVANLQVEAGGDGTVKIELSPEFDPPITLAWIGTAIVLVGDNLDRDLTVQDLM